MYHTYLIKDAQKQTITQDDFRGFDQFLIVYLSKSNYIDKMQRKRLELKLNNLDKIIACIIDAPEIEGKQLSVELEALFDVFAEYKSSSFIGIHQLKEFNKNHYQITTLDLNLKDDNNNYSIILDTINKMTKRGLWKYLQQKNFLDIVQIIINIFGLIKES